MVATLSHGTYLTTNHSASSYGNPVLVLDRSWAAFAPGVFVLGPADDLPIFPGESARAYVAGWLRRSYEEDFDHNVRGCPGDPSCVGTLEEARSLACKFVGVGV